MVDRSRRKFLKTIGRRRRSLFDRLPGNRSGPVCR